LPPTVAVLVAIARYASLPNQLVVGPRFVTPVLDGDPADRPRGHRSPADHATDASRTISLALIAVIVLTNLVALGQLVSAQVKGEAGCCSRRCRFGRRT
jgi:hypothetical protein